MTPACVARTSSALLATLLATAAPAPAGAPDPALRVPISGFQPQVVYTLTTEQGESDV